MKKKTLLKELNLSSYVAIDFETTGLDPNHDRIIEVAAILFKDGEPKKTFSTFVNPGQNIPSFITSITGISNSMVSQSPKESEIINIARAIFPLGPEKNPSRNMRIIIGSVQFFLFVMNGMKLSNKAFEKY